MDVESEEDDELKQGCWQKFRFFLKHSFRDALRHKCHFCLAFCSVFIVVLSTLVVSTIVSKGPIVFVSLAEFYTGEMDFWFMADNREWSETFLKEHQGWEFPDREYLN